jgi:hypothetical protein
VILIVVMLFFPHGLLPAVADGLRQGRRAVSRRLSRAQAPDPTVADGAPPPH